MLRVSDRLPFRRQSGGGKHVVTRKAHQPLTGLAHVGVATAMVVGLTLVVINPSSHDTADANSASGPAWAAQFSRAAGPNAAAVKERAQARSDIAGVATQAVSQVADVRAKAQQANLPADQLATLDGLAQQVNTLVGQMQSQPKVSRSIERASDQLVASPSAVPTQTADAATADPSPAADVAQPTDAAAPETVAATPAETTAPTDAAPATDAAAATAPATDAAAATAPVAGTDAAAPSSDAAAPAAPAAAPVNVTDTAAVEAALPDVTAEDDPTAAALRAAIVALSQNVAELNAAADQANAAAAAAAKAAADAAAAQAAAEQAAAQAAAQRAAWKASLQGFANGRIPSDKLCALDFAPGESLRCDAAESANALNAAHAQAFGANLVINDSYRSYGDQVACLRVRGSLCARPGTSNHGLGIALDIGSAASYGSASYQWLTANGPAFGWHNPDWARPGGSKHEPWHWEYVG